MGKALTLPLPSTIDHDTTIIDILIPPFESSLRTSPRVVATFNLVATIVGGGVLSLPLAFDKCGVILATLLMLFSAYITNQSLYLLCLAARMTGATSYGNVGRDAFGPWMETSISVLLFVFLLFVLTAYMVLLRDIWTPLVVEIVRMWSSIEVNGDLVLFGILVLMSPFLVQRTLYALRFNCYTGFASVSILCLALMHHAFMKIFGNNDIDEDVVGEASLASTAGGSPIKWFPERFSDALFAFPIIMLSFLSAFNVLPIQNALIAPTRERTKSVVTMAVTACFILMYCFGLGGYLFAGTGTTHGNILLNCDLSNDWMFLLGRIGCGITIMLALAMMMLPCRDSLLEVVDLMIQQRQAIVEDTTATTNNPTENTSLLVTTPLQGGTVTSIQDMPLVHYGSTLAITLLCYIGAVLAPGVAIVWSLCGSSMAFLIAFLLPAACYVQLGKKQTAIPKVSTEYWKAFSWFLIVFSVVGAVACTTQTILMLKNKSSPM